MYFKLYLFFSQRLESHASETCTRTPKGSEFQLKTVRVGVFLPTESAVEKRDDVERGRATRLGTPRDQQMTRRMRLKTYKMRGEAV